MEDEAIAQRVIPVNIEDEMKRSYIDYAMSVIVGRALPDARDGLKPVHRRILYAMHDMGIRSRTPYKKCARIVGEVLGKYHPHGDMAVYDALVRMAQDFNMRYPLIDGQGNFGSVDGDSAAAMRYTEARLARIAEEMLLDIDKDTVDFLPNFDESLQEPEVLPAKLPCLLVNGSSGIAVGMATNIPPHNLTEVIHATVMLIDNPEVEVHDLMEVIKGPDFPTGGIIHGKAGIVRAYTTGRGALKIRARTEMEETRTGKTRIVITELPYQVNKARLIESIAELVKDKRIEGISDLRDESDREGMRVVIEVKKNAVPEIVLNQLFKHTQMESTFGIINLALVDGEPKVLNLKETLQCYIGHRQVVVRRRTQFELDKAEKRAHILEGLLTALDNIDAVIKLIRGSKSVDEAREGLITRFELSKEQAQAILDMRLQKLTGLEREKIEAEYTELKEKIAWYREVLASEEKILGIIKEELLELKEKYGDERRTEIREAEADLDIEDLIAEEDMVVITTRGGYIKRVPVEVYRSQGRGGKGVIGMETKEEDSVKDIFIASTHDYMLFFTNRGRVHWLKVYRLPESGRYSRGKAIVNLLEVEPGEGVTATFAIKEFKEGHYLMMATKLGKVKKTELTAYSRPRRGGIIAIGLQEGDELIEVVMTDGWRDIVLATRDGKAIRFPEEDARPMGRPAMGVRGIRLRKGDRVVGMVIADEEKSLLTVTENGFGKRTPFSDYPLQRRGGQGVINIKTTKRNGKVVGIQAVSKEDEVMFTSAKGIVIRVPVKGISVIGRNTQGVTLMRLQEGDKLVGVARVTKEEDDD